MNLTTILEQKQVIASVPCRIDFGGTLDISTFYLPLAHLKPATFNLALDMRTRVTLSSWVQGKIKISSHGFDAMEFDREEIRFDHPMGLMLAIARFFDIHGVHIRIHSTSPPRSALGGSSSAAVAVVAAVCTALGKEVDPEQIAWLAHYIESSVAGVPCGVQDQAAAAFGGANLWEWQFGRTGPVFRQIPLYAGSDRLDELNHHILVAYCGIPHVSKDINGQWVAGFTRGENTQAFQTVVALTRAFFNALQAGDFHRAGELMIQETRLRLQLTPGVLDKTGEILFQMAVAGGCGARFTGAGGGGCLWAAGTQSEIQRLKGNWQDALAGRGEARVLETRIDTQGIVLE